METAVRITGATLGTKNFEDEVVGEIVLGPEAAYELQESVRTRAYLSQGGEDQNGIQIEFILWRGHVIDDLLEIAAAQEMLTVFPFYKADPTVSFDCVLCNPQDAAEVTIWGLREAGTSIVLRFLEQVTA